MLISILQSLLIAVPILYLGLGLWITLRTSWQFKYEPPFHIKAQAVLMSLVVNPAFALYSMMMTRVTCTIINSDKED